MGTGFTAGEDSDGSSDGCHSGYDEGELLKLYNSYLQGDVKDATFKKVRFEVKVH